MKRLMAVLAAAAVVIPMSGMADVVINAYAQDGATAYLYDADGNTYGNTTFSSGQAVIATAGLATGDYGLAMAYRPGAQWFSQIGWGVEQFTTLSDGASYVIQDAITGEITTRSVSGTTGSVTLEANGPIGNYDNDTNLLNAQLSLYRPVYNDAEMSLAHITNTWDAATLGGGFGYTVEPMAGSSLGLSLITLTNNSGFYAEYAGMDNGGESYDLYFRTLDTATAFEDGLITAGANSVTFTVDTLGDGLFDLNVPYYLNMDAAWIYDSDGNYSEAYDLGVSLTNPDVMVIPEPAVASLIGLVGVAGLMIRRIFRA